MTQCCTATSSSCCSPRKMTVDLLYIDRDVCTRCQGADTVLDEALADAVPVLRAMGIEVEVRRTLVETEDMAIEHRLESSPTIRINGQDIQPEVEETTCESCGTLVASGAVDCRVWTWQGQQFASPPKGLIVEALMKAAVAPPTSAEDTPYSVPENLRLFFQNKSTDGTGCGCY